MKIHRTGRRFIVKSADKNGWVEILVACKDNRGTNKCLAKIPSVKPGGKKKFNAWRVPLPWVTPRLDCPKNFSAAPAAPESKRPPRGCWPVKAAWRAADSNSRRPVRPHRERQAANPRQPRCP